MPDIYFEDLAAGQEYDLGSRTLDRAAIVDFATEFDPQPFHVDEEAAEQSIYGGLIASGWQTCGVYMRLLCDSFLLQVHSMGSPGVDELRWLGPVRPGDTLSAKLRIDEVRVSKSKPDRGIIMTAGEVRNQEGDLVLTLKSPLMVRRRQ
ncbi:MAG: MaoC family dehydratase [Alphaproteobacteria bacterium]|nr:MaoC family dehydratase [Alphaproteobacteria bacterium]